jgi:hypothetical protein
MKVFYVILKTKSTEMRKIALRASMSIFTLSILFHLLVIMKVIPNNIMWGGRRENQQELMKLETISITLKHFFLVILLIINTTIKVKIKPIVQRLVLWLMSTLFILNTIGNLLAKSSIETIIFTPVTILLSMFSLYLAINFRSKRKNLEIHRLIKSTQYPSTNLSFQSHSIYLQLYNVSRIGKWSWFAPNREPNVMMIKNI